MVSSVNHATGELSRCGGHAGPKSVAMPLSGPARAVFEKFLDCLSGGEGGGHLRVARLQVLGPKPGQDPWGLAGLLPSESLKASTVELG